MKFGNIGVAILAREASFSSGDVEPIFLCLSRLSLGIRQHLL